MTVSQIYALLPILILAGSVVFILLLISFYRNNKLTFALTALSFAGSFLSLRIVPPAANAAAPFLLVMDGYAKFYTGLFLFAAFAVTLLSYGYFRSRKTDPHEFCILLILATTGASVLCAGIHFVSIFLGLEILSISLYTLIAYIRDSIKNIEAGMKYLILAAASSAFLLFGMSLFYAETGAMDFSGISQRLALIPAGTPLIYLAFCLTITGFGFKLAIVPFHIWTPDVYEGAPAPVTAYIATVSKGAMFALLLRFFFALNADMDDRIILIFTIIAIASMFTGNILALKQNNVKRLLAYSSIAHLGYLLVALIAGGNLGAEAVSFYLTAYFVTTIGAFGIITVLSGSDRDADSLDDYRGLFWKKPLAGAAFTASLLSLAGIPITAGFIGKYYIVLAGMTSSHWTLIAALAVNSVISLYYYLRIIVVLYEEPDTGAHVRSLPRLALTGGIVLSLLVLLLIWIGVYPQTLIDIINAVIYNQQSR